MWEGLLVARIHRSGSWTWSEPDTKEARSAISYWVVSHEERTGYLCPRYKLMRTGETLAYRVGPETTRARLGGLRWWFTCPLVAEGRACRRRCGKLYLAGRYFGCRVCHDLTYTSCRESHRWDAMWRQIGAEVGIHPRLVRRIMEREAREDRRQRRRS